MEALEKNASYAKEYAPFAGSKSKVVVIDKNELFV